MRNLTIYPHSAWLFFKAGYIERFSDSLQIAGKYFSYLMLVWVWSVIWSMVPDNVIEDSPYSRAQLTWYVAVTEAIIFSAAQLFYDMNRDIKSGAIGPALIQPISYHFRMMSELFGRAIGQMSLFFPLMLITGFAISGEFVFSIQSLALCAVMIIGALLCFVALNYCIGAAALWLGDASPAYWMSQKIAFLMGGLLFPLTLYPEWLYDICIFLPFSALFFLPGATALGTLPFSPLAMIAMQCLWVGVFIFISRLFHQRLTARIGKTGE